MPLAQKNAKPQRVLWASTGTKNPGYSDIKYVIELIAKPTVNTLPEKTLEAFLDHGSIKEALTGQAKQAQALIQSLKKHNIDINNVCEKLLSEGVSSFDKSFEELLTAIENKTRSLCPR